MKETAPTPESTVGPIVGAPAETIQCKHCRKTVPESNAFCEHCGFPQQGTEAEKAKSHAERIISHSKSKEAPRLIRKARNTLFIIAGITLLFGAYYYISLDDLATFISMAILAVVYLMLGFWSQKKPLIALVLGLLVYLTTVVINGIVAPETIFKGIILKAIIIVFLIKGINSALHLRNAN